MDEGNNELGMLLEWCTGAKKLAQFTKQEERTDSEPGQVRVMLR